MPKAIPQLTHVSIDRFGNNTTNGWLLGRPTNDHTRAHRAADGADPVRIDVWSRTQISNRAQKIAHLQRSQGSGLATALPVRTVIKDKHIVACPAQKAVISICARPVRTGAMAGDNRCPAVPTRHEPSHQDYIICRTERHTLNSALHCRRTQICHPAPRMSEQIGLEDGLDDTVDQDEKDEDCAKCLEPLGGRHIAVTPTNAHRDDSLYRSNEQHLWAGRHPPKTVSRRQSCLTRPRDLRPHTNHPCSPAQSRVRRCGKSNTSRIDCWSVKSITRRSTPVPKPPHGGIP